MICRVHGTLESLRDGKAELAVDGGLTYELLLPAFASARLGASLDTPVTLHTVHYLEGNAQSNVMTPRLAGFLSESDRAFFKLFTSVKGIGPRKALRAMALATNQIAAAIADRDVKLLQSLPEIGKRTAETVVASLHGKVDHFIDVHGAAGTGGGGAAVATAPTTPATRSAAREAIEVLTALGENRTQAIRWIDELQIRDPSLTDTEALVAAALRMKSGV